MLRAVRSGNAALEPWPRPDSALDEGRCASLNRMPLAANLDLDLRVVGRRWCQVAETHAAVEDGLPLATVPDESPARSG